MQAQKAVRFRALHQREGAFIIPNPWDIGTARLLGLLGSQLDLAALSRTKP